MTTPRTSLVNKCWHALHETLEAALEVPVTFGWPGDAASHEHVVVLAKAVDLASQEPFSFGRPGTKTQVFQLLVHVETVNGHETAFDAVDRLDELQSQIETAIRAVTAPGPNRHSRPDVDGVHWWDVTATNEHALAHPEGFGWIARSELIVTIHAQL